MLVAAIVGIVQFFFVSQFKSWRGTVEVRAFHHDQRDSNPRSRPSVLAYSKDTKEGLVP